MQMCRCGGTWAGKQRTMGVGVPTELGHTGRLPGPQTSVCYVCNVLGIRNYFKIKKTKLKPN